jgi:hypothetical protein
MSVNSQIKEIVQATQADMQKRWNELAQESRQWVADQVELLNEQAQQLQAQSRQLRKALRREARRRRKLLARRRGKLMFIPMQGRKVRRRRKLLVRLRESSADLSKDLLKRGGKITQNLLEFGGKTTHDLSGRSGEFTQELAKRSSIVTEGLAKRGERLLEPVRKRDRTFWMIVGFGVGLVAAGAITYQLVRRMARQEMEQDEHIELPQSNSWDGSPSRPAGEIRHIDQGGASVATLEIVDVETIEQPADAAYVGVESTKLYYSVAPDLEPEDLVYFATEEEARARGFTAAE